MQAVGTDLSEMDQELENQRYRLPPARRRRTLSSLEAPAVLSPGVLSPGISSSTGQDYYLSEADFESTLVGDDEETNIGREQQIAVVEISAHGDLILELSFKRGKAKFKVSSQVLCLASPVFRAMLGPASRFKEAVELRESTTETEPYILRIEDDDPEALAIVLFAIHLQNSKVPTFIKEKRTIWNMAIICDKYDCTAAVSVWVDIWAEGWRKRAFRNSGHGLWLFISWIFGLADVFSVISKKIILEGHYETEGGKFLSREGWNLDGLAIPDPVMEKILKQRRSAILSMIGDSLFYLDKFLVGGDSKPICCYNNPSEDCDLVILGSITREYQTRIGLYPNHEKFLLMSVTTVEAKLRSIKIRFLGETTNRMGGHASTCNFLPELFAKITTSVSKVEGLQLEDFGSRQGLPIRRAATDPVNTGLEETYNPSLTLLKKLFAPRRKQLNSS